MMAIFRQQHEADDVLEMAIVTANSCTHQLNWVALAEEPAGGLVDER